MPSFQGLLEKDKERFLSLLSKNTSAAALYRTIGIRKNLRVIGLLLLYWAAIFTGWIWYSRHSGTLSGTHNGPQIARILQILQYHK